MGHSPVWAILGKATSIPIQKLAKSLHKETKLARLGKWLAFSDYPSSILRSNLKEGFFGLKLSLSISKLCFSDAASYYDNFNMTKNKITSFEALSLTTLS